MTAENPVENAVVVAPDFAALSQTTENAVAMPDDVKSLLSGSRLASFKLMVGQSEAVKTDRCPINVFAIEDASKTCISLGKEPIIVPCGYRTLAIDKSDKAGTKFYYNAKSPEFIDCMEKAEAANGLSDWMAGVQMLLWLPEIKQFAAYYLCSYSSKKLGGVMCGCIGKPLQLGMQSQISKKKGTSYMAPTITHSSVSYDAPDDVEFKKVYADFMNPKDSLEVAADEAAAAGGRDR